MTHIGLLCPSASGHLNPMTTLGHELQQRGHRVTLIGTLDAQSKTLAAGLEFRAIGETMFPLGATNQRLEALGQLSGAKAFRYTIALFQQMTSALLQEMPAAIKRANIEFLIIDQTSFGGSSVAQFLDLPFVSVCCALMINQDPNVPPFNLEWPYTPTAWGRLRNQMGHKLITLIAKPITKLVSDYREQWRLPPLRSPEDAFSSLAQLCQQPSEFEFPRQNLSSCFHFTGPYSNPNSRELTSFPFEKLTGQPLIYASLGTVQNRQLRTFEAIAAACQHLDTQLVLSLGGGSNPDLLPPLPGNPIVVGFAPQLALLQKATLTITHAGMNTTLESLANGVPMVAIPIANDQPGVAARIAWTGTGEVVSLKTLTVLKLRTAIEQVLQKDSYRKNALKLATAIQQAGGVKRAADIVEQVINTQKPVLAQSPMKLL
jgi:zeaxanthin glucosyltransferase